MSLGLGVAKLIACLALVVGVVTTLLVVLILNAESQGSDQEIHVIANGSDNVKHFKPLRILPEEGSTVRRYKYGTVASNTITCSRLGTDILARQGGSAVDAAIAVMVCVGVINGHNSGLGGGHVMTIYDRPTNAENKIVATVSARERAPLAAHRDMFLEKPEASLAGGLSIAVPGEVRGFYEAWKTFGRLPWKQLFEPTRKMCQDGFKVETILADAIAEDEEQIRNEPNLSEIFVKADGTLVQEGDILKRPKLAETLRKVADNPDDFYNGQLADDIVADIADAGGIITKEDMETYTAGLEDPVHGTLKTGDYTLYGVKPPSSGIVILFLMKILDGYHLNPGSLNGINATGLTYHRIAEALKYAFAKRSALGDGDFVDIADVMTNMSSSVYAEEIRRLIDDAHTYNIEHYGPSYAPSEKAGTSHSAIFAPDGGCVAITSSINFSFGSGVRGSRTGIIFNNHMMDFSAPTLSPTPHSPSNNIAPGKRPLSAMSPIIVMKNGHPVLVTGATSAVNIPTATAFVTMQHLWFGRDLLNATDTPRMHHQLFPNEIKGEPGFSTDLVKELKSRGHSVRILNDNIGVVGSIANTCKFRSTQREDCLVAVTDGRKGGVPDGF